MAGSNKQIAKGICPLIDTGVPKGEVWVQVKKAVLPFHVEEVGAGPEGLAKLREMQAVQREKDQKASDERVANARAAFCYGSGDLLDSIKAEKRPEDIITTHSLKDLDRQKELFPEAPKWGPMKTLWECFKKACKDTWDKAQPHD